MTPYAERNQSMIKNSGLKVTRHADRRMQQRGFQTPDVQLVIEYGTLGPAGRIALRDRDVDKAISECKQRIQRLEHLRGCVIVTDGGHLVTCYRPIGQAGRRSLRPSVRWAEAPGRRHASCLAAIPRRTYLQQH